MSVPTLDTVLLWLQASLFLGYPLIAFILVRAALRKPRISALSLFAYTVVAILVIVLVYIWAVVNYFTGSPVQPEWARVILRLAFLPLQLVPWIFLYAYRTGKFGEPE